MSKKIQKIVSITTSVATITWMSGIAMLAPLAAQAVTINEGDTIKTADNPDVYIAKYVGAKKFKRLILNPEVFNSYKHLSWSAIKTVSQAELDAFTTSELVRADGDYKVYKLEPNGDVGAKHWINMTAEQFVAAGYDWDSIYLINMVDRDNYTAATDIGGSTSTGDLQVKLSASAPAAGTIVTGSAVASEPQGVAKLAAFDFTAPSGSAVKITSIKMKRTGISDDTTLVNVYLYDGINRLTDSATVSNTYINWNNSAGIISIPAGTTKTVVVKTDIKEATTGQTVAISIEAAADITTDGATISGTFPVSGNTQSIASSANLAEIIFSTTTYPSSDGTPVPQNEFELWRNTVTINTRAVNMNYLRLRQIGSVTNTDLANFKLYADGVQIGSTVSSLTSDGYVVFDLSGAPKKLESGSRTLKVLCDLVNGSTRTASLSLRTSADAVFIDTEFNTEIRSNKTDVDTYGAVSSTAQTIAAGTLTISKKSDSPSGNVVDGASGVKLASFEFKAAGESIKVETLRLSVTVSDGDIDEIRNGKVFANGVQIGSTADIYATDGTAATYTDYSLGSSLIVVPGSPATVDVYADIVDSDGSDHIGGNETLKIIVESSASSNAQKLSSLSYFDTPSADVEANTLTVKTGALSLAKYTGYANHSAVAPKSAYKLGEWRLTSDTTEPVNLTSFEIDWDTAFKLNVPTDLSSYYITYADKQTTTKTSVATTSDSDSISYTLAAGSTIAIAVYADVKSGLSATTTPALTVNGTTANSNTSANSTETNGQTITWTSGSIATAALEEPLDQQAYGGQTLEVARYEITATSDSYTLEEFAIMVASGAQDAINAVYLYDAANPTVALKDGGIPMNANYATTTGLSLPIPANTTKTIIVKLGLNSVGTGAASSGLNASTTLVSAKVRSSVGTQSYINNAREGNAVYVFKAYPVLTLTSATALTITNDASADVYKFKVTPMGGTVAIKQFKIALTWADNTNLAALELDYLKLYRAGVNITDNVDIQGEDDGSSVEADSGLVETNGILIITFATEDTISSETEYTIQAIPRNFDKGTTSTDSVVLTMNTDSSHTTKAYIADQDVDSDGDADGILYLDSNNTGVTAAGIAANFIWSDRNLVGHSYTSGSSSADWFNGYKVKNLPLTTVTLKP